MNWMSCRLPITLLHISRVEEILITLFEWNKYITVAVWTPPSQTQIMTFQWEQMKWANFRTHYKVGSEKRKVSKEWELIDGDWEMFVGFCEPLVGRSERCVSVCFEDTFFLCACEHQLSPKPNWQTASLCGAPPCFWLIVIMLRYRPVLGAYANRSLMHIYELLGNQAAK